MLPFKYTIRNSPLKEVKSYKYLGITINSELNWTDHIEVVCAAGKRRLGYLKRNFKYATSQAKLTAYKTLIRPMLEYASIIWDPYQHHLIDKVEKGQRLAARFILKNCLCIQHVKKTRFTDTQGKKENCQTEIHIHATKQFFQYRLTIVPKTPNLPSTKKHP